MSQPQLEVSLDRKTQILDAALVCFAKRGFHQTSMHDISAEAGISVADSDVKAANFQTIEAIERYVESRKG